MINYIECKDRLYSALSIKIGRRARNMATQALAARIESLKDSLPSGTDKSLGALSKKSKNRSRPKDDKLGDKIRTVLRLQGLVCEITPAQFPNR